MEQEKRIAQRESEEKKALLEMKGKGIA